MRMKLTDLRPELRAPELSQAAVTFLDLVAWRSRMVADLRRVTGEDHLTVTDANVMLHVFVFGLVDDPGSREAEIVNNLAVPRRTVRDSLALWERMGVIERGAAGYYPTSAAAGMFNGWWHDHYRLCVHLCSAFTEYRKAIGR